MSAAFRSMIPQVTFQVMNEHGPRNVISSEIFSGKNVVLFGVPGAYVPTCHYLHLPGFIAEYDALRKEGADMVACTSVNDIYVLDAWARDSGAGNRIVFLADGNGDFARAMGLGLDASDFGLGFRSRRYSMWVADGKIESLNIEPDPTLADVSSAYMLLKAFTTWANVPAGVPA